MGIGELPLSESWGLGWSWGSGNMLFLPLGDGNWETHTLKRFLKNGSIKSGYGNKHSIPVLGRQGQRSLYGASLGYLESSRPDLRLRHKLLKMLSISASQGFVPARFRTASVGSLPLETELRPRAAWQARPCPSHRLGFSSSLFFLFE